MKDRNNTFLTPLIISPYNPRGTEWVLYKSFSYEVSEKDIITVPKGFVTNFASIPRLFWNILPPYGKYGKASLIHDYLYSKATKPRKQCDKIFLDAMQTLKVGKKTRYIIYYAVRIFGARYYKQCSKIVQSPVLQKARIIDLDKI